MLGGSETNALKIIRLSKKKKFDWLVLNSSNSKFLKKIKSNSNLDNFISLDFKRIKSFKIFGQIYKLFSILKKGDYKSVYAVDFIPSLFISLIKPFFAFKFISTRRSRMPWAKYYHMPFINFIYLMSDYVETNSVSIQNELQNKILTRKKVYFLPNIILRYKINKHEIFKNNKKYIGNVANVKEEKNIDLFLSLALRMINKNENIVFLLVGRDTSNEKVKRFIKKNKLKDRLILLEDIGYDKIFSIYLGLDIFLFTSKYEGSPNVLYEAMSVSLPIVASRIFATEELIDNGVNGYLCDLKNENEFIEKLNLLINNKNHYNKIKNNLKKKFNYFSSTDFAVKQIKDKILF
jgi:glycosyltransferase involved in cell wall biosynthesis